MTSFKYETNMKITGNKMRSIDGNLIKIGYVMTAVIDTEKEQNVIIYIDILNKRIISPNYDLSSELIDQIFNNLTNSFNSADSYDAPSHIVKDVSEYQSSIENNYSNFGK